MDITKSIQATIDGLGTAQIEDARIEKLNVLRDYVQNKLEANEKIELVFICTHNSRRSQLAQAWAMALAHHYNLDANCYSGGVEETAFYPAAVNALEQSGFVFSKDGEAIPRYTLKIGEKLALMFSKIYDDAVNPSSDFAAIMVCSDADDNCPFVVGCEKRISLPYEDPKVSDGTDQQAAMYFERSLQIASELKYVFESLRK